MMSLGPSEESAVNEFAHDLCRDAAAGRMHALERTALALVQEGKGILAADESSKTIDSRFEKCKIDCTPETRADYRAALFGAEGAGRYISGAILFKETLEQTKDGKPLPQILADQGIIVGLKVDGGTEPFRESPVEKITKGLEEVPALLKLGKEHGVQFAKWRAVITIQRADFPTEACLRENARRLARYAVMCQEAGIVPICEPEVLMDGDHDIRRCDQVTRQTLTIVFDELKRAGVHLEGMLLKPNMVVPGKKCPEQATAEEIARMTLDCMKVCVPPEVPGFVFLSGGQSADEATANLAALNRIKPAHDKQAFSFSYGRALQDDAMKAYKAEGGAAAARAFLVRAKANGEATRS